MTPKVLFIEATDYRSFPVGGQLTFSKHMIKAFGSRLALVGISTDDTPVGVWVEKEVNGVKFHFFSVGRRESINARPLVPARLSAYFNLSRHKEEILNLGIRAAFVQAPETIMCISGWDWDQLCYRFAGVDNPLTISRYPGASIFAGMFERLLFRSVSRADLILAAADNNAIEGLVLRSKGILSRQRIVQFPTRVDTQVFHPASKDHAREALSIDGDAVVVVTTGRVHWAKGYPLLLDAFRLFLNGHPDAYLFFVGDGESRGDLQKRIDSAGLSSRVIITGQKNPESVATYLNASDVFALASFKEGWSTVMVEALCCGKPIVSTDVSSARDIIVPGVNGYVVDRREPQDFADAMAQALILDHAAAFASQHSLQFALERLASDLSELWPPIRG